MRYQNILIAALCMFGCANSAECNERFDHKAIKKINNIAKEINIDECSAGNVYDFMNEGHKFSYNKILSDEDCKAGCVNEASKTLKGLDESVIENLLSICEGKCYLEAMALKEEETEENVTEINDDLEKRASKPCDPISKGKVSLVKSKFKFGYNQYKDAGSKKTALSQVNGCGPKQAVFGISAATMKKIPYLLDGTFEAACNMHDICYACKKGKSTCDSRFLSGMKSICNKRFPTKSDPVMNAGCKLQADLFYGAVSVGGNNAYNNGSVNTSTNCAACGVTIIKNTLVKTPFYKK